MLQRRPKGAAPARLRTPAEEDLDKARLGEIRARTSRINEALRIAKDPKATLGQLSAYGNFLVRQRDSYETPEEDKPQINEALKTITKRLGEHGMSLGVGGSTVPGSSTQPGTTEQPKTYEEWKKLRGR